MKIIIASGYFNPLHKGHIEYFRKAKKLGDQLWVIVNNDYQVKLKGSTPFMNINERVEIISALGFVDDVIVSIDRDLTVCQTLAQIKIMTTGKSEKHRLVLAKGGDRFASEIPEAKVCKELGIRIVDGLGKKIQSSSELLRRIK